MVIRHLLTVAIVACCYFGAARSDDNDLSFLSAVRSLLYGENQTVRQTPVQSTAYSIPSYPIQPTGAAPTQQTSLDYSALTTTNNLPQFTLSVTTTTPCNLPQQIGTGPYRIPRWYFNPARMRCELFYWSGCCGNGNNFNTFQSCQQVCEGGKSTRANDGLFESAQPPADWLNAGKQVQMPFTTINLKVNLPRHECCNGFVNNNGGGASFTSPRWFYESQTGNCEMYLCRPSTPVSTNSYPTLEDCQRRGSVPAPAPAPAPVQIPSSYRIPGPIPAPQTAPTPTFNQLPRVDVKHIAYPDISSGAGPAPHIIFPEMPMAPMTPDSSQNVIIGLTTTPRTPGTPVAEFVGKSAVPETAETTTPSLGERQVTIHIETPNPCLYSGTVTTSSAPLQCGPNSVVSQTCGGQQFCHIGATPQTTVCCPKPPANIDRCNQPLNSGIGNANLQRWYFNPLTQQCQPYTYKGLQGNENNFIQIQDCENSCMVNPCKRGTPYRSQGVTVQCSATSQAVCPAGYYCHIGANSQTTVCCQALVSNPCNEALDKGEGSAALTRFFYDSSKRQCLPYNYLGTKGNTNNFLSKEACEEACPVWVNPCSRSEPLLDVTGRPIRCTRQEPCSAGYYCHIGFEDDTTVCCPATQSPCAASLAQGTGPHVMTRWYYDSSVRQCKQFTYRGLGGNENNFLLREHCEELCPVWENPCASGDPVLALDGRPKQCVVDAAAEEDAVCGPTHWCHPGATPATTVCCPNKQDPCVLAMNEGTGEHAERRWYFDLAVKQCKRFTYRGMTGNANNFLSKEDCEGRCPVFVDPCPNSYAFAPGSSSSGAAQYVKCQPDTQQCPETFWCHVGPSAESTVCCPNALEPCSQPPKTQGSGDLRITRWTFDPATQQCEPFEYFGIRGNQNNFLSRDVCESTCPVFKNPCRGGDPYSVNGVPQVCKRESPCPQNYYCHIGANDVKYCCPAVGGDPCGQPMDPGTGGANLARWYWNQNAKQCLPFTYCGKKGTQNNFLNQQDCLKTCNVFENPCAGGEPQMTSPTTVKFCSVQTMSAACAPSYWCHIGATQDTTVCCPNAVQNICEMPLAVGSGNAQLTRWYFNAQAGCCMQFTYRGRFGNQNNFLSYQACEQACARVNPCTSPIPNPPQMCSVESAATCSSGSWCHFGAVAATTLCCPNAGNPCTQPLVVGSGTSALPRWWYNQETGICEQFVYKGLKGNQNNFLSEQTCLELCLPNPCYEGSPFVGVDGRTQHCSATSSISMCPASYWCHTGASQLTTVCCPGASQSPCNLPMSTGEGNARLERWYYDQGTKTCQRFYYNGLKGNQNNFLSQRACQLTCQPVDNPCIGQPATSPTGQVLFCSETNKDICPVNFWCHLGATPESTVCCPGPTNPCSVPLSPGTGDARLARWYYNVDDRECVPFQYNGMRGNQNNFVSQPACERTCPGQLCLLSIDRGACGGRQTRYAYDRQRSQCVSFEYTGCGGNLNNFQSMQDCMATCGSITFR